MEKPEWKRPNGGKDLGGKRLWWTRPSRGKTYGEKDCGRKDRGGETVVEKTGGESTGHEFFFPFICHQIINFTIWWASPKVGHYRVIINVTFLY